NTGKGISNPAMHYILFLSEVEVDILNGKTKVLNFKAVSDVGVVGNILAVEGQAFGGISHGIGFALKEDYSDFKRHSTMAGAGIPTVEDIPDNIDVIFHVTPRKTGPFGSSGCAESFQSSPHMAVINAIKDAVGIRIYELPATPEKIKAALDAMKNGKELKPEKYNFGKSFAEVNRILDDQIK
ncbi:MAG TPA: molybdopterin-dependent oxidoreductase, partial [Atribacterota bacterium]|nr:molybdopterin-dependent oxidoreductase [Atribacterota bacterium]